MDLREILRATRRRRWLAVTCVALSVGIVGLLTLLAVPQYATSVTFFVTTPSQGLNDAYQGGLFSQQRVKSYANLLAGDRLAHIVAANATFPITGKEVHERVTARVIPDTVLLEATVIDASKERSLQLAQVLADRFAAQIQLLETTPGRIVANAKVDVVAGPTLGEAPVSPRPVRNLALATLLGLVAGVGAAAMREMLDSTAKSSDQLQAITGSPTLAVIPFDASTSKSPLLTDTATCSRAESMRHMRTNLQFVNVDSPVRAFVVTSAVPGEGKSTTSVNTAIAFAQADKRVLLIDADLRRPKIAEYLDVEGAVGLSNVLAGQVSIKEVTQRWGRHQLWVLPSGSIPPNPSELLGSKAMAQLLAQQREEFDVIVIDTPPLLPVTDAAVLAAMSDGAVLVTRSGKTPAAQVKLGLERLHSVDARVLGCVLNMHPVASEEGYYAYYGQRTDHVRPKPRASAGLVKAAR